MQRKPRSELFTKAFPRIVGGSRSGVYTREARGVAKALPLVPLNLFPRETLEPRFYLSYLQGAIRDLAEGGYIKALKLALKEYRDLCRELSRGCQC